MTNHKSEFLRIVRERGFLHQCTDEEGLGKLLHEQSPVTAYIGFDCTAPSLHVGSLVQIMILRWFQKCGHRPIVVMGGGTTKIGDPSGKDEARKILSDEQINANIAGIKDVFGKFLSFSNNESPSSDNAALMLNNDDWLKNLNLVDFLRNYGRHFSVNRMLTMDSVKLRLEREQFLSFLEFNYMILQAFDFVMLRAEFDCRLQIGGSDQWGNIVGGIDLYNKVSKLLVELKPGKYLPGFSVGYSSAEVAFNIHPEIRKKEDEEFKSKLQTEHLVYGLTTPLITTASGTKMGKTENGAVWLNADMCSPFDYWQFWRNTEDADVGRFLRFFTELPIPEIQKLEKLRGAEINKAKKILANEATRLCHGPEAADAAAETARKTFEEGGAGENLRAVFIDRAALEAGIPAYELFYVTNLKESKGEARKLVEGGGARINDEKVTDPKMPVTLAHLTSNGYIKLSSGKKHHVLVKAEG